MVDTVLPDHYQGDAGGARPGGLASLVDEVLGRVHMGNDTGNPRFMYTAKMTIQYRHPVPAYTIQLNGQTLSLTKKRSATSKAEIQGSDGKILVEAEALLINVPEESINSTNLESLGWKVYNDSELNHDS